MCHSFATPFSRLAGNPAGWGKLTFRTGTSTKERRGLVVIGEVEGLGGSYVFAHLDFDDLTVQQGNQRPEPMLENQAAGGQSQPGGQDAVGGAG